jgi:hypothetical protein
MLGMSGTAVPAGRQGENNMHTNTYTDAAMTMDKFRDWVASREAAAATIDIETCELGWWYGELLDPYGLIGAQGELLEEERMVGRNKFVRSPDSGGWVHERDLSPAAARGDVRPLEREYHE